MPKLVALLLRSGRSICLHGTQGRSHGRPFSLPSYRRDVRETGAPQPHSPHHRAVLHAPITREETPL
ncbi:protein of unknown function [Streptomyces sp. KY75]|nr:protein of unknown function [Streptomyces sp. KY75]CAD5973718.1 protein of unknown function [Streptomyces sp. KY70]